MKKRLAFVCCVVALVMTLCSCGNSVEEEIVGTWTGVGGGNPIIMEFKTDNTYLCSSEKSGNELFAGDWEYDGEKLTMTAVDSDNDEHVGLFTGEKVGESLVLDVEGDEVILTRE